MRILAVADLHYSLQQFDWLLEVASVFDVIVIAGDLLDIAGHADLDAQIVVVGKYLDRLRAVTPVLVCSGNHDGDVKNGADEFVADWLQDARAENLFVDGDSTSVDGGIATICPWWDGPVTRAALDAQLKGAQDPAAALWIWLYHGPPAAAPVSWAGKRDGGDAHLNELVAALKPDFVFSGHIHNAPFYDEGGWCCRLGDTWVFNPGREMGARPTHIVIDLEAKEATWFSSMGVETASLA